MIGLLAPALLTALILTDTFAREQDLTVDARAGGPGRAPAWRSPCARRCSVTVLVAAVGRRRGAGDHVSAVAARVVEAEGQLGASPAPQRVSLRLRRVDEQEAAAAGAERDHAAGAGGERALAQLVHLGR